MKILLLSDACFNDNIFPLFKAMLDKGLNVTCLINLSSLHNGLIDIKTRNPKQAIINAKDYPELRKYETYCSLDKMFIINHEIDKKHVWRELLCTIDIVRFIQKGHFDVIHTDFLFNRSKVLLYLYRKKVVYIRHDPFPHSGHDYTKSYKRALTFAYKLLPKVVILNNTHFKAFCEISKRNPRTVFTNSLGPLDSIKLYTNTSIKPRENNILFFGRIVKYKGLEYLCEAMTKVHETIPDATLTIAGSGKFYFNIESYEKLDYIEIHNHYIEEEKLAQYIQQCSISVCAYTDATQSGGILTSFAFNKPVIASDLETLKEIVKDEHNAILVPPCDVDTLAVAIIRLLRNKELRMKISNNIAQDSINGACSWSKIVDRYLNIYRVHVCE